MDTGSSPTTAPVPGSSPTGQENPGKKELQICALYIDDEPALLDPIKHYLERKQHILVDTATSAKIALEMIAKKKYDVIVSDYQMPVMDGIQLVKKLRAEGNQIPFIIFTGKGHEDIVVEAYDAGADFYLPKGGNPRAMFLDLTQKITQIVTRKRYEDALLESEERYRKVVEQTHDAIVIFQGWKIVFVNNRATELSGYSREEIYGMNFTDLIHPDDRARFIELAKTPTRGIVVPSTFEIRTLTRSGEVRSLEIAVTSLIFDGEDSALCSIRDITERRLAEDALRKSEEKYRSIFTTFDDLYYQTDMDGTITTLSPSCKKITGWDPEELIGTQVTDLYPFPDQRRTLLDTMFLNGAVHDYEVILKNKKGEHLNVSVTSHVVRDQAGKPVAVEGALRDITHRIQIERALQKSEERFRLMADFLPVMIFETDTRGILTFGNQLILPVFGVDPEHRDVPVNVIDYIVPEQREIAQGHMKMLFSGVLHHNSQEYLLIRRDGTAFPAMVTVSAIQDDQTKVPSGMRGVIIDLTELKQAENALRESENYLKTIFNSVPTALLIIEPGTYRISDINPAAVTLIGKSREEILGSNCYQYAGLMHEQEPEGDRQKPDTSERVLINARGERIPILRTISRVSIAGKEALLETISDITDRKRAEDAIQRAYFELEQKVEDRTITLRKMTISLQQEIEERNRVMDALKTSEDKYRSLVEQTNDLIFHINDLGIITYISPNVLAILGYTTVEMTGRSPLEIMPESSRGPFTSLYRQNIEAGQPVSGVELTFIDRNNVPHIFEINGTPRFDPAGKFQGFSGIAREITYRKHLQDEIAASLKEKEILLKEIHHRVKNNMQVISSLLSLQAKMIKDPKSRDAIKESQNRVMSIALVHEKLYQSKNLSQISFREYIERLTKNLFESYSVSPDRIAVITRTEEIILPISKAIPVSLIINELISNSIKYAFPQDRKGVIEIIFMKEEDSYFLEVRDNGVGLPGEFRLDQTDTLGLQLVNSLTGQLAGTITFESGGGTTFRIEFPAETSAGDHFG